MTGAFPNPLDWLRLLLTAQKAQLDVTEKVIEASTAMLDPARTAEAGAMLDDARKQALEEAALIAKAQWELLSQWRC